MKFLLLLKFLPEILSLITNRVVEAAAQAAVAVVDNQSICSGFSISKPNAVRTEVPATKHFFLGY